MNKVTAYSGIVTKVRAMQGKLLKNEDFAAIANMKSVPEIVEYIKGKPSYAKYIESMSPELYHRGNVEKMLYQSLYDDYTRIYRFAGLEIRQFLKLYWKQYEVELIDYCFGIVFNHSEVPFDIDYKKQIFDRYSDISIDKLVTSRNIDELVDNLSGTEYYEPLRRMRESNAATLFDYELALELYTSSTMWKKGRSLLKGKELESFKKEYGTKLDLLNIQWIYRAKKYYNMLPPDIYALIIPIHSHISEEELKSMVEAPTAEAFLKAAEATRYAQKCKLFTSNKNPERAYRDILKGLYLSEKRKNPYSINTISTYLHFKEDEITKLTTALECVRYGLTPRETLEYIGGVV